MSAGKPSNSTLSDNPITLPARWTHGVWKIGRSLHEDPPVLNYVQNGKGPKIKPGLVLAIEPMINLGSDKVRVLEDGWTVVTADGRPSAHFEHTIAVTPNGTEILTKI